MKDQEFTLPNSERPASLALRQDEPSVGLMLQSFIEHGITAENVSAFEKLCDVRAKMKKEEQQEEFARAFAAMQAETGSVMATRNVTNKDGSLRYKFAPYEEIMRTVQPMLKRHGFAVTFDTKINEGRITSICTLMHTSGHTRSNEFAVRIGQGPPGSTDTQADGAAKTYAKRGALCDALNIVVEIDDDARLRGKPIDDMAADFLRQRVKELNVDEAKFLRFAAAATFEEIALDRLEELHATLDRREKK